MCWHNGPWHRASIQERLPLRPTKRRANGRRFGPGGCSYSTRVAATGSGPNDLATAAEGGNSFLYVEVDAARSTVARFYRAVARYLQSEGVSDSRSAELEKFCNELRIKKVNFLGRFSSKELDEYIARPPRPEDINKERLTNVKAAIDCLSAS
jgi:hypothetical protein